MKTKSVLTFLSLTLCSASSARAETLEWIRQLGAVTTRPISNDISYAVSADGLGSVYIAGFTEGSLEGTNAGGWDAFLSKYDASGTLEWTQQLGTSESEEARAVSADGLGSVYISGLTKGSLEGTNEGDWDAFVAKYDAGGTLEWTQQLGTSEVDVGHGVSADGLGSVYMSGYTYGSLEGTNAGDRDAFISKYDASGTLKWTQQLGTSSGEGLECSVSADGLGSVYIAGGTKGSLGDTNAGSYDAFVAKYNASGTLEWTQQLGTNETDSAFGVSADGLGSVYIAGWTDGDLEGPNAGGLDAFLSKYDASGTLEWTQQLGTSETDWNYAASADGLGSVYVSGRTNGSLGGININVGEPDAFISKYDASGTLEWTQQLGTSESSFGAWDVSLGVSADGLGSAYISGFTDGNLGGPSAGPPDAFVAKFTDLLLGDVNLDGDVNGLDVDPFVEVLLSGPYQPEADMNEDGAVDGLDVDSFVAAVIGVGGADVAGVQASVPESSTLVLAALGSLGLLAHGWRRRQHMDRCPRGAS